MTTRTRSGSMHAGVSLRDVAVRAGVGVATASSILNGSKSNTRVSEDTRKRVEAIAAELDYHPNALARALSGRPTRTLGLMFGMERATVALANPFIFAVVQGLVAGAAIARYNVTIFTEPWHDAARSGGPWRDGRTDGVILLAVATDSDVIPKLSSMGVPIVSVASGNSDPSILSVDVDNIAATRLATYHLMELGHCRIAHLAGDVNLASATIRSGEFVTICQLASLEVPDEYVPPGTFEEKSGYDRTRRLLALDIPPTAIFAASDIVAVGAIQAAHDCGVNIPGRLSIIGVDDAPYAQSTVPQLTTIRQPLIDIGNTASSLLIDYIEGRPIQERRRLFPPELVVRGSTAPLNI